MSAPPQVVVRRHWNDWRAATVPFDELEGFCWDNVSGGVMSRSPRPMVYAYMLCSSIPDGVEFGHSCAHGPGPHRIKVVVVAKDNDRLTVNYVRRLAGARPS